RVLFTAHHREPLNYQTIPASKRHDTATARKKHAAALELIEGNLRRPSDYEAAHQTLNEALVAAVTSAPAHKSLGMLYYLEGELYLAAWEFEYASKLMPENPEPFNNLALVYEKAGKYEDAINYYSMAMAADIGNPQVMGNLVRTRMITG